jgi:site-specific recombinase XerD
MAERIYLNHGDIESAQAQLADWRVPSSVKAELARFVDDLAMGKVNRGKRLSVRRQVKYLYALRVPLEFLNKPTRQLKLKNIEAFDRALQTDQLRSRLTKKPFAHGTQVDMRILLRIFLRWRLGQAKAKRLTGWLDVRVRPKTPDFLSEAQMDRLFKSCRDLRQRFLLAVLFDAGARAEEFHNIRMEDVYLPEGKQSFVRIALKTEYSKTHGRTVPLYWKHSLEAVQDYLQERVEAGAKANDPVFVGSYDANKKFLQRLGERVLKRSLHYHLFRHSSATYYATKLNRQELCYRYGWKFSSNMPDVYISRAGMQTTAADEKFQQTELGTLRDELSKVEQAAKIKDERIAALEAQQASMNDRLALLAHVLALSPSATQIKKALEPRNS